MLTTVILIGVAVITACAVNIKPTKAADDSNFVVVGEIYENCNNVQQLYNLISGAEHTDLTKITELATAKTNAADLRAKTYNKTNGQDIQVTFGGKVWDVVYLSTTNDNRPILTLWLHEPFTESQWNQYLADGNSAYPSDLYGTSYIRALLNNSGTYATSGTEFDSTYSPDSDYVLQEFLPDGKYGSLIVTPSYVAWQETNVTGSNDRPNTFYGVDVEYPYDHRNYAKNKTNGGAWKNDNLWLPSIRYETLAVKPDGTHYFGSNFWQTSINQLNINHVFWGRDGDHYVEDGVPRALYTPISVAVSALSCDIWVNNTSGVRPALHLDLQALNAARTTEHNYGDWSTTTAATCTATGVRERVCQDCGYVDNTSPDAVVPATGHNYTPVFDGRYTTYTCSICGYVNDSMQHECNSPDHGHDFLDTVVPAECENKGYTIHKCLYCNYEYQDKYVPATGHSYGAWVTVEPATTDAAGVQKRTCHCGAEQTRSIAPLAGTTNNGKDNSAPLLWGIIIGIIAVLAGCGGLAWLLLAVFKPRKTKHTEPPKTPTPSKTKPSKEPNVATA